MVEIRWKEPGRFVPALAALGQVGVVRRELRRCPPYIPVDWPPQGDGGAILGPFRNDGHILLASADKREEFPITWLNYSPTSG